MKKLFILIAFIAFGMNLNAQSSIVKANPIGLAFGAFNICYEKVLNDKGSLLLSAYYFGGGIGDIDVKLFGAGVGYRIYLTKKEAPRGFYVMPNVSFGSGSEDIGDSSFFSINVGADLGYQWVWDSGFTLDLGLGPNYRIITGDDTNVGSGILPSAVFAVGIAF